MRHILCLASSILTLASSANAEQPKVLLLGDSISIVYTPYVQQMLKDEATVLRPMKQDGLLNELRY